MRYKKFILALAALGLLSLLPTATRADNLSFAFTPSAYTGSAGSVVTLFGTFQNGANPITFAGFAESLEAGLSLTPGAQPFDALIGLTGGETLGPIALFNVLIDAGTADGTVFTFAGNQFTVFYDPTAGAPDQAAANFSITVRSGGPNPVPEPASIFLLGTGLAGLAAGVRKRWRGSKV